MKCPRCDGIGTLDHLPGRAPNTTCLLCAGTGEAPDPVDPPAPAPKPPEISRICESIEEALIPAILALHGRPDLDGMEEITIGCMTHGPSPKKTFTDAEGERHTLPCIGCHPEAWAEKIRDAGEYYGQRIGRLEKFAAFAKSCIQSGETWTPSAEAMFKTAVGEDPNALTPEDPGSLPILRATNAKPEDPNA